MSRRFDDPEDYGPSPWWPDMRAELACVLECARKVCAAWHSRNDHPYAEHVLEHEIDRLQMDLHCIFGDEMPKPRPMTVAVVPVVEPAALPVHARREMGRLAIAS